MHALTARMRAFGSFWWEFVVGDDWRLAAGVVAAFTMTAVLAHFGVPAWWVVPVAALAILSVSVIGSARARSEARRDAG